MTMKTIAAAMRQDARSIFDHALTECSVARAFERSVRYGNRVLSVRGDHFELARFSRLVIVSIGKAGHSMADAFTSIVPMPWSGIVACPAVPSSPVKGLRYFAGGHPMPNEESLRSGTAILEFLRKLPDEALVVFLISGGASALAEWPLDGTLTLSDIIETNWALVLSGAPIAEINAIRKHLSAIKGGRMAQAAAPATQVSLMISDVPASALDALASGPTMPDHSTVEDCYEIAGRFNLAERFPDKVRNIFEKRQLCETPKVGDAAFANSRFVTLLSNHAAVSAAAERAAAIGFTVELDNRCDDWDYARAADYLLKRLRRLRSQAERVCLISGGEVTVKVGMNSGVGGRNQQFALYCAQNIAGESMTVLSAGTDGVDGNSTAAGAVVDGTSVSRAQQGGQEAASALADFNAFPFLEAIGDTITIGPTGNNVRDLRVLLAY
jgi:hydroxypyruvate reductase